MCVCVCVCVCLSCLFVCLFVCFSFLVESKIRRKKASKILDECKK